MYGHANLPIFQRKRKKTKKNFKALSLSLKSTSADGEKIIVDSFYQMFLYKHDDTMM